MRLKNVNFIGYESEEHCSYPGDGVARKIVDAEPFCEKEVNYKVDRCSKHSKYEIKNVLFVRAVKMNKNTSHEQYLLVWLFLASFEKQ